MTTPAADHPPGPRVPQVLELAASSRIVGGTLGALWLAGIVVLALGVVFRDRDATLASAVIVSVAPLLFAGLRAGRVRLAASGAIVLLFAVASYVVLAGSGIHDVGTPLFAIAIVLGALLLDRRESLFVSATALVLVGLIGTAELTGAVVTRLSHQVVVGDLVMLLAILAGIAWLTQILVGSLRESLRRAFVSEQTYREIYDSTNDGIIIHDAETGRIVDANAKACEQLGLSHEEFLALSLEDLAGGASGQNVETLRARLDASAREGPQTFEWTARRKDGKSLSVEVSLRAALIRGEHRIIATTRDITDRKAIAHQALASERLQAVGQLAGGVAHDFNNQLTAILANAVLLRERVDDATARTHVDAIIQCSNRSADLTRQLLAFARKQPPADEVVDVDALVEEVMSLLERSIDKRIQLSHRPALHGTGCVKGDPSLLQNALLNLGLNARDAMPRGGLLRFETDIVARGELGAAALVELEGVEGPFVRVRVTDTGAGMTSDVAARVFEPFFTTKQEGNGMGLAATYGTVRAHDGAITVATGPDRGTTFEIVLPATRQRPQPRPSKRHSMSLPRLHVLLAEDDLSVAHITEQVLRALGCSVTHCEDGQAALDTFTEQPEVFDLVLLDHAMPRMTGAELAVRLRRLRPTLPIVATSGFSQAWNAAAGARHVFLPKPFDAEALRCAIEEALAGRPAEASPTANAS